MQLILLIRRFDLIKLDQIPDKPGTYILVLQVCENVLIQVKTLQWTLNPGIYLYFGSAKGRGSSSLKNRIKRHFNSEKTVFWHIDYLTTHPSITLQCAYLNINIQSTECQNLKEMSKTTEMEILSRFGSSDCKQKCGGHLGYLTEGNFTLKRLDYLLKKWKWKGIVDKT